MLDFPSVNHFVYVDPTTGKIMCQGHCTPDLYGVQEMPGFLKVLGKHDETEFWWNAQTELIEPRPTIVVERTEITANGSDFALISGIPAGGKVRIDGEQWQTIPGDHIEFAADVAGDYLVEIDAFPAKPVKVAIHAT